MNSHLVFLKQNWTTSNDADHFVSSETAEICFSPSIVYTKEDLICRH